METINTLISLPLDKIFQQVSQLGDNTKYKYDEESKLIILYVPYNACYNNNKSVFEKKCRTAIINYETKKVNVYVPNIQYNTINLSAINLKKDTIIECYEGTVVYVYHDNGWKISTRRCLDATTSYLHNKTKNHKTMFEECINMAFDEFVKLLKPDNSYAFTIVHHENIHLIDYTLKFDKEYKKLVLTAVTIDSTKMYNIHDKMKINNFFVDCNKINDIVVLPRLLTSITDIQEVCKSNMNIKKVSEIQNEGVIVIQGDVMYKLHSDKYKKFKDTALDYNKEPGSVRHLIHLYQQNKLQEYFEEFSSDLFFVDKNQIKHNKIILINSIIHILASETYNMFLKFWKANENGAKNEFYTDMYENILTVPYKELFYVIRGAYFKNKGLSSKITHYTVFNILKTNRTPDDILRLIKGRKMMLENEHLEGKRLQMIINEYDKNDFLEKYVKNIDAFWEFFESNEQK